MVADELVSRGHTVTLFAKAGSRTRATLRPIVEHDFRFRPTPAQTPTVTADGLRPMHPQDVIDDALSTAIEVIAAGGFDVVLNNSLEPQPYRQLSDHPMLTVLHTPATLERVNAVVADPAWRSGARHVFAAVSQTTARQWSARVPGVRCVLNGVDLRHWAGLGTPTTGGRQPDLAVWAARITPEKGLHLAIDAAEVAGLRLRFSGPISDPEYYRQTIAPRLGAGVQYAGHLDHHRLPAFLRRGAVFLSTPRWEEPFGLAMVEAMAAGTPVAALAHGAAAEIVSPAGGVLARADTAESLAAAALQARALDPNAVRDSVARFDKSVMIDAYERILNEIVHGISTPAIDYLPPTTFDAARAGRTGVPS